MYPTADDEFESNINKGTIYDGERTCLRCGRTLEDGEIGFCDDCDADDQYQARQVDYYVPALHLSNLYCATTLFFQIVFSVTVA